MAPSNQTPELEQRQITIALPPEVWEILDGTNEMALTGGSQGFEEYVAALIINTVSRCLHLAEQVHTTILTMSDHAGRA